MDFKPYPSRVLMVLLVLCLGFIVSCGGNDRPQTTSYDQANEQIEQGNYGSAATLMEDELRKNPGDRRARTILASAYAARAGLSIRSYVDLIQEITDSNDKGNQRMSDAFGRLSSKAKSDQEKDLLQVLTDFNRALWQVTDVLIKFEKIPRIETEEQYKDVQKALNILNAKSVREGGPAIYRGLLRIVLFRYHLDHYYKFPEVKNCHTDLTELYKKVSQFRAEISYVLEDFTLGALESERSEKIAQFAQKTDQAFARVTKKLSKYSNAGNSDISLFLIPFGVQCE